jgi:hypothetical protein
MYDIKFIFLTVKNNAKRKIHLSAKFEYINETKLYFVVHLCKLPPSVLTPIKK